MKGGEPEKWGNAVWRTGLTDVGELVVVELATPRKILKAEDIKGVGGEI